MNDLKIVPVFQGETRVSDDSNEIMSTILGSCVAACIWDPVAKVGGMNHFLLPGEVGTQSTSMRYGVNAMELLVNGLLKHRADRARFKVKLFGGAKMFAGRAGIGEKNIRFANWYVDNEGFELVESDLGGERGRKIKFWPTTGRVQQTLMMDAAEAEAASESLQPERKRMPIEKPGGDIELF